MLRRFGFMVLLPGVVLLLFGLRTLEQDRVDLRRQIADRLENAVQIASRSVDRQFATWQQFRDGGITISTDSGKMSPPDLLAYEMTESPPPQPSAALINAERLEFRGDLDQARQSYARIIAEHPRLRRQSLVRLAATDTKAGKRDLAAKAYLELLRLPVDSSDLPNADLIARFELCLLGQADRPAFYHDLTAGRWKLDKARYLFYSQASREWVSSSDASRSLEARKLAFSDAVEDYLQHRHRRLEGDCLAFWNEKESLILPAKDLRERLQQSLANDPALRIQIVDQNVPRPALFAAAPISDRDIPWIVMATPADPAKLFAAANHQRSVYLALLILAFLVLATGTYMTGRAVKREMEVARLRSEFVSTVSHEFRSPLTAIAQLSELLQRGRVAGEEKRQEYYALIARESSRLSRLVENLLDFSRMEEGRAHYQFERLETSEWLDGVVSQFARGNMNSSVPLDLPPIQGDRTALTSAVENLLDNAVKYSPPGSLVTLEAEAGLAELIIRVRDRGYGIADEDRAHVFEKFYRGKGEMSRQIKGAGVGLSLVREIVRAHGGRVDFDSCIGEGTEFRIWLRTV